MSRLTKIYSQPEVTCTLSYISLRNLISDEAFKVHINALVEIPCKGCDTCLFFLTGKVVKETLCPD